jgi:hypothetical protein
VSVALQDDGEGLRTPLRELPEEAENGIRDIVYVIVEEASRGQSEFARIELDPVPAADVDHANTVERESQ